MKKLKIVRAALLVLGTFSLMTYDGNVTAAKYSCGWECDAPPAGKCKNLQVESPCSTRPGSGELCSSTGPLFCNNTQCRKNCLF